MIAVLSLKAGGSVDEESVMGFARTRVAGYKLPRRLLVVQTVPRAPNGKADYKSAKAIALEAEGVSA